jgi:hypothetical protein
VQPEGDPARLAGFQRYPDEAGQPAGRPDDLGHRVAQVQLDDLVAGPGPGVADRAGDHRHAVRADLWLVDDQVGVGKAGVRQAVAEGE